MMRYHAITGERWALLDGKRLVGEGSLPLVGGEGTDIAWQTVNQHTEGRPINI